MATHPARTESVYLTPAGQAVLADYTDYLMRLREALTGRDGTDDVSLPTEADVACDIHWLGWDEDGDYLDCWAVTEDHDADEPLVLRFGHDFVCM